MRHLPGLEADERLRAAAHASFRGATSSSGRGIYAPGSARARAHAFDAWAAVAQSVGFPTAGPDMVIGVTDTRLVVWRTSFFLGRPVEVAGSMPLRRVAQVSAVRLGIIVGLAFVVDGTIIELEAMRGRRLRQVANELRAALAEGP